MHKEWFDVNSKMPELAPEERKQYYVIKKEGSMAPHIYETTMYGSIRGGRFMFHEGDWVTVLFWREIDDK